MSKLKKIQEEKASVYTAIDEMRKSADGRDMSAEENNKYNELFSRYQKLDDDESAETRYMDIQRKQLGNNVNTDENKSNDYNKDFRSYLMGDLSEKDLKKRAALDGMVLGAIAPSSVSSQIEVALKAYGGVLNVATILQTANGNKLAMPTINDTSTKAAIIAEYGETSKAKKTFSKLDLEAYTYRTPTLLLSQELLQDAGFDIETFLSQLLAENLYRGLNADLTTGSGTDKPKGIVTATTNSVNAATAAITLDNILDLMGAVNSAYSRNGKFMLSSKTLLELAKIKDNDGRYLWTPSVGDSFSATLFGKQYELNDDMPEIGASNSSVLYGDLSKYIVRQVKDFNIIRLNEHYAEYMAIGIFGAGRFDGDLLNAGTNPIAKLTHAAATGGGSGS